MNKLLKPIYGLFIHFMKGARIDAALQKGTRMRLRTMNDFLKAGAEPVIENGKAIGFDSKDMVMGFKVVTKGNLILKNNSRYPAYNLEILNADEIFNEFKRLPKLTSLEPNGKLEIEIAFQQLGYFENGLLANELPDIPPEVNHKILNIKYENEAGTKLLTKFWISFTENKNEHTYL
jgi:hypothetical protein